MLAGIVTLTRSIALSILFGWLVFIIIYLCQQLHANTFSLSRLLSQFVLYSILLIMTVLLISSIPKIHILEQGISARFSHVSAVGPAADYSNGRIYDEWIPALTTWMNSDWLSLFFGIGAG